MRFLQLRSTCMLTGIYLFTWSFASKLNHHYDLSIIPPQTWLKLGFKCPDQLVFSCLVNARWEFGDRLPDSSQVTPRRPLLRTTLSSIIFIELWDQRSSTSHTLGCLV